MCFGDACHLWLRSLPGLINRGKVLAECAMAQAAGVMADGATARVPVNYAGRSTVYPVWSQYRVSRPINSHLMSVVQSYGRYRYWPPALHVRKLRMDERHLFLLVVNPQRFSTWGYAFLVD